MNQFSVRSTHTFVGADARPSVTVVAVQCGVNQVTERRTVLTLGAAAAAAAAVALNDSRR